MVLCMTFMKFQQVISAIRLLEIILFWGWVKSEEKESGIASELVFLGQK